MRFADEYYFHVPDRRLITHRRGAWTFRPCRGLRLETLVYVRGTVIQPGEPPLRLDGWHLASRAPDGAAADEQPRCTGGCAQETEES